MRRVLPVLCLFVCWLTDPIKPGERRLISDATDLGLLVEATKNSQPQHLTGVKISKGLLAHVSELHERTLYPARNQDEGTRTLLIRSEEHTSELQSQSNLVCRLLLEKKN